MGTWINTGMYQQIWKAIVAKGDYVDYHWVVKADANAVFFPQKLMNRICQTRGYRCIKSGKETEVKYLKTCAEGKQCTVLSEEMTFDVEERRSMFCYSVYTANTGSTKPSYELGDQCLPM